MAQIVSIRRFLKQKKRQEAAAKASENAAKFGRTKAQRSLDEARAAKERLTLDQHKREDP